MRGIVVSCALLYSLAACGGEPAASMDGGADADTDSGPLDADSGSRDADVGSGPPDAGGGALTVHSTNPRYFADGSGKPLYMTSVYLANTLQDRFDQGTLDWDAYVQTLVDHRINLAKYVIRDRVQNVGAISPTLYVRTGPGTAADGDPKLDIEQINPDLLAQLRSRALDLRRRGIYVVVMMFNRFDVISGAENWDMASYNASNNINGIDGDANGDGEADETQSDSLPARVEAVERARIRAIIDVVADLDNVIFEVCNETYGGSGWQEWVTQEIRSYEAGNDIQHLVGQTSTWPNGKDNAALFAGSADWISPGGNTMFPGQDYETDPQPADGTKVIIVDSDHVTAGAVCSVAQMWKYFTHGLNPMCYESWSLNPTHAAARLAMRHTRDYADRMDLARAVPHGELTSTGYCIAEPSTSYLVYDPSGGSVTVDLEVGDYSFEWFDPDTGTVEETGTITSSGSAESFASPLSGHAVLFIWR